MVAKYHRFRQNIDIELFFDLKAQGSILNKTMMPREVQKLHNWSSPSAAAHNSVDVI